MIDEVVHNIMQKEYAAVPESTVLRIFNEQLVSNPQLKKLIVSSDFELIKKHKQVVLLQKRVKEQLRHLYASYHTSSTRKVTRLLRKLATQLESSSQPLPLQASKELHHELLKCHRSTKERLVIIDTFYKRIFEISGIPASIIDLGCGLNPLTAPWIVEARKEVLGESLAGKNIPLEIKGFELGALECDVINDYAQITKQPISAQQIDISTDLPDLNAEMILALKLFELLSTKRVEEILTKANVRVIVASYPTKTLSKSKMKKTTRAWFHLLLRRLQYPYKLIHFENELVYVIWKSR